MAISARNQLVGKVVEVKLGDIMAHVVVKVGKNQIETVLRQRDPDCMVMSARREADIATLQSSIRAFFQKDLVESELFLPWAAQQLRGEIFATCEVLDERTEGAGTLFRVRAAPDTVNRMREETSKSG